MKPEFYAFRQYQDGKRQELWRLNRGRYNTGLGILLTTKELEEEWESKHIVERVSKK